MASPDPKLETEDNEGEGLSRPVVDAHIPGGSLNTAVCVGRAVGEAIAGGFMGGVFGYGYGVTFMKHGFKGAWADAASTAKTFAILSGVHSITVCLLKKLRGKDDELNAGIAGCVTGFALSCPGAPQAMLQSCVTFGAFSWFFEKFGKQPAALALPLHPPAAALMSRSEAVLPLFTLALPQHMAEGFSLFCRTLEKPRPLHRRRA